MFRLMYIAIIRQDVTKICHLTQYVWISHRRVNTTGFLKREPSNFQRMRFYMILSNFWKANINLRCTVT
jgi:hypothetical protein